MIKAAFPAMLNRTKISSEKKEDSDCYSVTDHEVCVILFISSAWQGIRQFLLLHIQKSQTKTKVRLWTKTAETSK